MEASEGSHLRHERGEEMDLKHAPASASLWTKPDRNVHRKQRVVDRKISIICDLQKWVIDDLFVDFAPMRDPRYIHRLSLFVNLVDHAPVAGTDVPLVIAADQLLAAPEAELF